MDNELNKKFNTLTNYLLSLKNTIVAFSAGVDSTFLLKTAKMALGENVIAITVNSFSFPEKELNETINFCKQENIKHIIFDIDELNIEGFKQNPPNRCYLCKKAIFTEIIEFAQNNNINNIIEGSNINDLDDYRPGRIALKELNIKSPLQYANLNKQEIRILSKEIGLQTFDKPSFACLSSRIPYGEEITKEKFAMIEKSEQLLFELGFKQNRVRMHGSIARIEVLPEDFDKIIKNKTLINSELQKYGFKYVTVDLLGYRTGSMNNTL